MYIDMFIWIIYISQMQKASNIVFVYFEQMLFDLFVMICVDKDCRYVVYQADFALMWGQKAAPEDQNLE